MSSKKECFEELNVSYTERTGRELYTTPDLLELAGGLSACLQDSGIALEWLMNIQRFRHWLSDLSVDFGEFSALEKSQLTLLYHEGSGKEDLQSFLLSSRARKNAISS